MRTEIILACKTALQHCQSTLKILAGCELRHRNQITFDHTHVEFNHDILHTAPLSCLYPLVALAMKLVRVSERWEEKSHCYPCTLSLGSPLEQRLSSAPFREETEIQGGGARTLHEAGVSCLVSGRMPN